MTRAAPTSAPVVSDPDATPSPAPIVGERYERRQLVGIGGMGRVSVAWDRALGREVALKEPLAPEHAAALLEEARRAAALEHPGIMPVFDVGVGPDGAPWYTMRLSRGRPLEEALRAEPDLAGRLTFLRAALAACEAVAYAHARGVVHRDLTPSNLLLGELGEAVVADWGLAADRGAHGSGGTPGYRAPEQAAGAAADARADVYALGAVLFRVCAGAPPGPGVALPAETPPELAAIVGRATAADPAARYPDARALAEDLAAFLDGRRVSAHAYSPWELLRRLVVAWRAPLLVGATATFVLLVTATAQHLATLRERDRAVAAERTASANLGLALATHAVQALRAGATGEAAVLAAHAAARTEGTAEGVGRAHAIGVLAAVAAAAPAEALPSTPFPAGCTEARLSGDTLLCLGASEATAWTLDGAPRGAWPGRHRDAAWHASSRLPVLLDTEGRVSLGDTPLAGDVPPFDRFTLAGDTVVTTVNTYPYTLDLRTRAWRAWPAACHAPERLLATAVDDGGRLAVACSGGGVVLGVDGQYAPVAARLFAPAALAWLDGDLLVGTVHGDVIRIGTDGVERWRTAADRAALSAVGRLGASAVWARGTRETWILDLATGALRTGLPAGRGAPTFDDDGVLRALARAGEPAAVRAWRLPARWPATVLVGPGGLSSVNVSPDGARVAVGGGLGFVALWDVATGAATRVTLPDGVVKGVAWAPDGSRLLASVGGPNDLYVIGADGARLDPGTEARGVWRRLAWLPGGVRVGLTYVGNAPVTWDAAGRLTTLDGPARPLHDLGVGPGGAAALDEGEGAWRIVEEPLRIEPRGQIPGARAVDLGPDGAVVVATGDALVVLDGSGAEARRWSISPRSVTDVAWSPDGAWIATAAVGGQADVWDARTGALAATLPAHTDRVSAVEFAPDGGWLVTVSWDGTARRWALAPLREPLPDPAAMEARWGISLADTLTWARW